MQVVFNCNYGPWTSAAFMAKKREALDEYMRLAPAVEVGNLALDLDPLPPSDSHEDAEHILANSNFLKKGPVVKMSGCYVQPTQ
jgi:hypothetical protein